MTTSDYKDCIQLTYLNHLERLLGREVEGSYWRGPRPEKDEKYVRELHETMGPYYEQYLLADREFCCEGARFEPIGKVMAEIIRDDALFGEWASCQNLREAAEFWGDNLKYYVGESRRIYRFFHLLELLLEADCRQDWKALADELKQMLFKAEECYDYKTDEVLCVLHGFAMIMQQEWPKEKKCEQLKLLDDNWLFMKHYYSVMTRHPIGVKHTRFHKIAETVRTASQSFKPHMHIFYCGLLDCADELQLDRKHRRELDKEAQLMQQELEKAEPSDLLYELCDALFPEDFQRLLREHRPKSYKEVESECQRKDELIKQLQEQSKHWQKEFENTTILLEKMIASAIPMEEIDQQLMNYPPAMAFELLRELDKSTILHAIDAYRNNYPALLEKHRQRLWEPVNQQKELNDTMKAVAAKPTSIAGDYVLQKQVDHEVGYVAKGGIGIMRKVSGE